MNRFLTFLLFANISILTAQEPMRVTRSAAVDRNIPIRNIYIDDENNKWIGNSKGAFQLHSVDYATAVEIGADEISLLTFKGGNYNINFNRTALFDILKNETNGLFEGERDFAGAFYDQLKKELFIGTNGIGVFRLKTEPQLQLLEHITTSNSKLKTDFITVMFSDRPGSYWIGTEAGVMHNEDGKWKLFEKFLKIEAINKSGSDIWIFGEGFLWKVDTNNNWTAINLDKSMVEGKINDIVIDRKGNMWIASEVITRFNMESGDFNKYGAAEYFTSNIPTSLAVDQDNAIWVGTEDKGLYLIEKESAITVNCVVEKQLGCDGKNDAAISVMVSGGDAPYTFQWNSGQTGENLNSLGPGQYEVTVTDSKGKKKNASVTINDPQLTASATQDKIESAADANDGVASVSVSGGKPEYKFLWSNGETGKSAVNLNEGSHSVTVTDQNGCSATATVNITRQVEDMSLTFLPKTENKCSGDRLASLSLEIKGGKAPFKTDWNMPGVEGMNPTDLAAGDYRVTVTDALNNTATGAFVISEPESITVSIEVESPASTGNSDGVASAKVEGGTAPFTFKWDNGEAAQTASALAPGTRTLIVTDANGCSASATATIDENILPLSASIEQSAEIKCSGEQSAAIEAKVKGGKGPFQYLWNDPNLSGKSVSKLAAGDYALTVTDAEGTTFTTSFNIKEPIALSVSIEVESPASTGNSDGVASAKVEGGTAPFTFKWDNGEAAQTASALAPGTRTLIVTDANGCSASATATIDENILPLSASIEQSAEIKCSGEQSAAIEAKVKGGKGPFQYLWNDPNLSGKSVSKLAAGDYALTVTDAEGTTFTTSFNIKEPIALSVSIEVESPASTDNSDGVASAKVEGGTAPFTFKWDNGEAAQTASALAPGTRTLIVTDANGCSASATATIDENILPLSASIEQSAEIKCSGEQSAAIEAKVKGGKGPFQYLWNDPNLSGKSVSKLAAGDYALTVTDAEGTTSTASYSVKEPEMLSATITKKSPASDESSFDGKAELEVKGGTGNYITLWDNEEQGLHASQLGIGEHKVSITDENGCSVVVPFETKKRILPQLTAANLREGQTVRMEQLFFEADSFRITEVSIPVIEELYDFMVENKSVVIEVGGHTNNIPEHEYCDMLSSARAKSVANYIIGKGIDPNRVYYKGYGKRNPIATNSTPEGRMKNQRVEIKILSI